MTRARVWAATIFVDYYTKFVYVALMCDTAESAVEAKHNFEHFAATRSVQVDRYHGNNGVFRDFLFMDDVKKSMQRITFCGVNAHHQNGIVERTIKSLTLISRTLLLHAQRHWPEYITTMLWPLALKAAQDRLNQLNVNLDGKSPDIAPKWDPRARLGIYVGRSPNHAGNVALVLNPKTGLVSPQFHVVFDDEFTTVPHLRKGTVPDNWAKLVENSSEKSTDEFYDLSRTWFQGVPDESANELTDNSNPSPSQSNEGAPLPNEGEQPIIDVVPTPTLTHPSSHNHLPIITQSQSSQDSKGDTGVDLTMPPMINLKMIGLRRSPRLAAQKKSNGSSFASILTKICSFGIVMAAALHPCNVYSESQAIVNGMVHKCNIVNTNFDGTINAIHHMAFVTGKENNETYTYVEMLKQPDARDFIAAMLKESSEHENRKHWEVIPRSEIPPGVKAIQAIWSFKRKRFPDGSLNKHKARLCAHGGMQQWGVNYWETYAPVVNWISMRFLLVLSEMLQLDTRAIDFVLAFPQADLDTPVYMCLPTGMVIDGAP
ncbi:hypothetical protein ACHAXS_006459 [Conticribra weissflogii]